MMHFAGAICNCIMTKLKCHLLRHAGLYWLFRTKARCLRTDQLNVLLQAAGSAKLHHSGLHIELSDTEVDAIAAFPTFRHAVKSRHRGGDSDESEDEDEDDGIYGYGYEGDDWLFPVECIKLMQAPPQTCFSAQCCNFGRRAFLDILMLDPGPKSTMNLPTAH